MTRNPKPITEIESGQRYSETYDLDDVYVLISVTDAKTAGRITVNYYDQDGVASQTDAPATMAVYPTGPAPSVIKAAVAQLNRELNHPAMKAAISQGLDEVAGPIADYFTAAGIISGDPVIDQAYLPSQGWRSMRDVHPIPTVAELQRLARDGVEAVAVRVDDRIADFEIAQVIESATNSTREG
jgi:hypothetical protein